MYIVFGWTSHGRYNQLELREDILRVRGTCGEALQVQSPREWPLCFVAYDIIVLCMLHMARHNALTGSWA